MKLVEIKKLAEVVSKDAIFFKELYRNCVKAIEMVPDEFVKEAFDKAYQKDSEVRGLLVKNGIKNTCVSVCISNYKNMFWNNEEKMDDGEERDDATYTFKTVMFEDEAINVFFPLRENVVQFDFADDNWSIGMTVSAFKREIQRIFGKYLLSFENAIAEVDEKFFTN